MSSPVVTSSYTRVIAVVLFLSSKAQSTSYSVSVSPSTVGIGKSVTLSCRITNPSGLSVMWRRNSGGVFMDFGTATAKQGCIFNPGFDTTNYRWDKCGAPSTASPRDYYLQIIKAAPSDTSTWDCFDIGAGKPSDPVKVKVQVPPLTPTVTGLDRPVGVGTTHTLTCDAHQPGISDTITYTWYKDNIVKATGSTLTFNPITRTDAGTYKCEAKNAVATKVSQNQNLEVYYPPDTITLSSTKSTRTLNEQETFTCTTSGGNPPNPTLTIYRDKGGKQELLNGAGPTIEVKDRTMVKDDNGAKFYCESSLSGYPSVSKKSNEITYTVYYPHTVTLLTNSSTTVVAGTTFTLTCNAIGGNPENVKQFTWSRNGETLPSTSRVYNHYDVKYNDGGIYGCTATNDGGSASDSMTITVHYPPMWNPALPEVLTSTAVLYQPAKFTLHVIANPVATGAAWFRYHGPTNFTNLDSDFTPAKVNETTYTLAINSVKQSYFGQYKVDVTSPTGPSTFLFELATPGKPYPPCCLNVTEETSVSVTLTFKAGFFGGLAQSFTIEYRENGGSWRDASTNVLDPGTDRTATEKISGLKDKTRYEFRVYGKNSNGRSEYSNIAGTKTDAGPPIIDDDIIITRSYQTITITWPDLGRRYTRIEIEYCVIRGVNRGYCTTHEVDDTSKSRATITVEEGKEYGYTLRIYDSGDIVFRSAVFPSPSPAPIAAIAGGTVAGIVVIIIVVVVVLLLLKKRNGGKDVNRNLAGVTVQENPVFAGVYDELAPQESPLMSMVTRNLPNASPDTREKLKELFATFGVEGTQDLQYLDAKDIVPPLKLVEARKFLQQSLGNERRDGHVESIYMNVVPTDDLDPQGVRHDENYINADAAVGRTPPDSGLAGAETSGNPAGNYPESSNKEENAYASLDQGCAQSPENNTYAELAGDAVA